MQIPYAVAVPITKSDTADIWPGGGQFTDAIYVGGAGILVAVMQDNTAVQFTCIAGQILPVKAKRVNSTSTAASLMVALKY